MGLNRVFNFFCKNLTYFIIILKFTNFKEYLIINLLFMDIKQILTAIEESFHKALSGQEKIKVIVFWWGIPAYLLSYFVFNNLVRWINFRVIDIFIAFIVSLYFVWHIYVLHRCKPKKPQLTSDEIKQLELAQKKDRAKKIMRKFLLREPVFKWNQVTVITAFDLLCIAHFSSFFFR